MRALSKTLAFVVSFAVAGTAVSAAFAETQWERNHPRRDQVNDRLANQNRRINRELKEARSQNNKPTSFTGKTTRFARKSATWPKSTPAISPKASKKCSISRKTTSVTKLGAEESRDGRSSQRMPSYVNAPALAGAFCLRSLRWIEQIIL